MNLNELHEKVRAILSLPPEAMPEIEEAILSADYTIMEAILDSPVTPTVSVVVHTRDVLDAEFILDDVLDAEYLSDE